MAAKLVFRAMKTELPCVQKMVYLSLCDYANKETHECFPSYDKIARKAGVSKRTAITVVETLAELGLIQKRYRSKDGKNTSNIYRVLS